jgi:hypothetical protein
LDFFQIVTLEASTQKSRALVGFFFIDKRKKLNYSGLGICLPTITTITTTHCLLPAIIQFADLGKPGAFLHLIEVRSSGILTNSSWGSLSLVAEEPDGQQGQAL